MADESFGDFDEASEADARRRHRVTDAVVAGQIPND
jgi:hypothetical protein